MTRAAAAEIVFDRATKRYAGTDKAAVEELSLTIPAGEICILVGPSGAGKTTAMKLVNRLIELDSTATSDRRDERPRPGRRRAPPRDRLRDPAGRPLPAFDRRREHRDRPAAARLGTSRDPRAHPAELLELVGLEPDYGNRYPAQLSGGQRQRVGLARALAVDPPLMLMDEPFGALDPITRDRLQAEFLRLHEEVRKTVIFVTHDIDEAIKLGDRIALLREGGHLAQYDTPDRILAHPADDFVARFVGADRGLKRLALRRL